MTDPVELTKQLVRIKSCNPGEYEGEIGDYIYKRLKACGIPVRKQKVFSNRNNIIAEIKGKTDRPPLVMLCHTDTVVVGDGWTEDPFAAKEKNGFISGRGACDMKSGLACALSMLEDISESRSVPERTICFIATVDEEAEMKGIQSILAERIIPENGLLMDLEPTSLSIATSHKGRIWYRVKVQGITAHASTPWKGADAIAAAAYFISRTRESIYKMPEHPEMGTNTVTFGMISGGYQPYVVPDTCTITMDVRTVAPYTLSDIENLMQTSKKEVEFKFRGIDIAWELTGNRPYVKGNVESELCKAICKAHQDVLGQEARIELFPGYTDTAVASAALKNDNFLSFGPGALEMAHKPNEYVMVDEIIICKKVLEKAVKMLCF